MPQSVVGIVAEYNPFHWGHQYQLDEAKKRAQTDIAVVVLSSNVSQRGLPAFMDKKSRALAALYAGADLVLELPAVFSCHNSGVFTAAAVDILAATKVVTHLSFGMENPTDLNPVVSILNDEPLSFKNLLKESLAKGSSFVQARCDAIEKLIPGSTPLLSEPNNSLALGYAMRVNQIKAPLTLIPVERIGAGYHDKERHVVSSATAVRSYVENGQIEEALQLIPHFAASLMRQALKKNLLMQSSEYYWLTLQSALLLSSAEKIARIAEMREGMENLLMKAVQKASSLNTFVDLCTSRRYTKGRILRHCLHFLLGLDHWTNRAAQRLGPPYIRVLGTSSVGKTLLRKMHRGSSLPIISRSVAPQSCYSQRMMQFEHAATQLRDLSVPARYLNTEKDYVVAVKP